jgi:hypothetical protein
LVFRFGGGITVWLVVRLFGRALLVGVLFRVDIHVFILGICHRLVLLIDLLSSRDNCNVFVLMDCPIIMLSTDVLFRNGDDTFVLVICRRTMPLVVEVFNDRFKSVNSGQ